MKTIHVYHVKRRDSMFAYFVTDDRHVRFLSPFLSTCEGDHESVRRLIAEKIGDDYIYGVSMYPLTVIEEDKRLAQAIVEVEIAGKDNSTGNEFRFGHQCPFCLNEFDATGDAHTGEMDVPMDVCSHFHDLGNEDSVVVYRGKAGDLVGDEIPLDPGRKGAKAGAAFRERLLKQKGSFTPRPDLVPDIEKKKAICEGDLTDARLSLVAFDNENRHAAGFGVARRDDLAIERRILRDMIKAYERQIEVYEMAIAHNREADNA